MTEWSELAWTGLGLIAAAVVLSLMFIFTGIGKDMNAIVYQDQADAAALREIRAFLPYDNTTVNGAEAMSAMLELSDKDVPTLLCVSDSVTLSMYKSTYEKDVAKTHIEEVIKNTDSLSTSTKNSINTALNTAEFKSSRAFTPSTMVNWLNSKCADFSTKSFQSTLVYSDGGFVEAVVFRAVTSTGNVLYD